MSTFDPAEHNAALGIMTAVPPDEPFNLDDPLVRRDLERFEDAILPEIGTPCDQIDYEALGIPMPGTLRYRTAKERQERVRRRKQYLIEEQESCAVFDDEDDEPEKPRRRFVRDRNVVIRARRDLLPEHGPARSAFLTHLVAWMRSKYQRDGERASVYDTLANFARPLEMSISTCQRTINYWENLGVIRSKRQRRCVRLWIKDESLYRETDPTKIVYSLRVIARHLGFFEGVIWSILRRYTVGSDLGKYLTVIPPGQGYASPSSVFADKIGTTSRDFRKRVDNMRQLGFVRWNLERTYLDNRRYFLTDPWTSFDPLDCTNHPSIPNTPLEKRLIQALKTPIKQGVANLTDHGPI